MSGSAGRPHRGRRDNGLDAPEFIALADVDPRIGEHLLDLLGVVGIAAYLAPSADLNPVVRATTLPARPTDRLWVDRERISEARGLYEAVQEDEAASAAPARSGSPVRRLEVDVDFEWERIIAGYDATATDRPSPPTLTPPSEPPAPPDRPDPRAEGDRPRDALPMRRPGPADPTVCPLEEDALVEDLGADRSPSEDATGPAEPTSEERSAPNRTGPNRTGPNWSDPNRSDPDRSDPDRSDPNRTDPDRSGPNRTDPNRTDPDRSGPNRSGPESGPSARGDGLFGPVSSVDRLGFLGRDRLTGTDAPPSDFDLLGAEEGYVPPPPPPLPRLPLPVVLALLAITAGLILLFRSDTLGLGEQAQLLLALAGILGGTGVLVWRLRDGWDENDPDDGAVV